MCLVEQPPLFSGCALSTFLHIRWNKKGNFSRRIICSFLPAIEEGSLIGKIMVENGNDHRRPLQIAVFPFLAFGHIIPFLELSKAMARKGHKVYLLSTPRNLKRMPKIPESLIKGIELVELRLPSVDGLPEGAEATADVLPHEGGLLKVAYDGLKEGVVEFLKSSVPKIDWIVHDFAPYWLPEAAGKVGVPSALLTTFPAWANVFTGPPPELITADGSITRRSPLDFTKPPEWVTFPSTVAYKLHEAHGFVYFYRNNISGLPDSSRLGLSIKNCHVVAIRSSHEFESEWLPLLQTIYDKKVIPIGLLPPPAVQQPSEDDDGPDVFQFLNKNKPKSVLYVALGSEAMLSVDQVHELALGIEKSQVPFLWALKKPLGVKDDDDTTLLPDGFQSRTADRGLVIMGWVAQTRVLAHESIGCFLTHAGLNSMIEGLSFGHPLVALPIFADQGLNARVIVEKKVGVEVERKEEDGSFAKDDVAKAVRIVMVEEEEREEFRKKAAEMRSIVGSGEVNDGYVDGFIKYLRDHSFKL